MAHNDLMAPPPHHYARLAELGVVANLSWQWAGLTDALEETYRRLLGPPPRRTWSENLRQVFRCRCDRGLEQRLAD